MNSGSWISEFSLPPYGYVPGRFPHPISDPRGHLYGKAAPRPVPLDPAAWQNSGTFLWACELFNEGFYWEAHEEWEGLWHVAGRRGIVADFLKSLIKLAAAGVKLRERNATGAERHAKRAAELLAGVSKQLPPQDRTFCGLAIDWLQQQAVRLASSPPIREIPEPFPPTEVLLDWRLEPNTNRDSHGCEDGRIV